MPIAGSLKGDRMKERKDDSGNRQHVPPTILSVDRRSLLKASVLGIGATVIQKLSTAMGDSSAPSQSIVETAMGRVRGRIVSGVHIFKGIPYGASTAGKNRFMPPAKPDPWAGVRDALEYGHSAPQTIPGASGILAGADFMASTSNPAGIGEGEDCLALNVWTPSVKDNHKRPVMVWCHGGAFTSGSGSAPLLTVRISPVVAMSLSSQSITASACSAIHTSAMPATHLKRPATSECSISSPRWPGCVTSSWFAGGGFKAGHVHGRDRRARPQGGRGRRDPRRLPRHPPAPVRARPRR